MNIGTVILIIILLAGFYWWFFVRSGRLDFWKACAKHPDLAYEFFNASLCWQVFEEELPPDYRQTFPSAQWDGPFRLFVPKLGNRMIYILGKVSDYEASEDEFLRMIEDNT